MIAKINGTLERKVPGEVIINVGGVGYQVFIPLSVFYRLPEVGGAVSLYIHTHLREDALQLFGFLEHEEKQVFLSLNSVTGIGPKLAINILSGIPAEELARALKEGDQPRLVSIPGVGKKLAERMIVELRDKFLTMPAEEMGRSDGSQPMRDAISALVNLGYRQGDAEKSVREITRNGEKTLAEVLKEALRRLSQ
ncbi:MAG TPA: Holliday junction branch migration protein RuvA [Deltaproteobacteria bacterium]|nr:MAG: Holliday junction DNA helicase RuvA [Deltaproteobacteria bacterium GWD2_55_8]HBA39366.1 Holliday junction branch migration protein RuvA [Deltaproteobacteria bacterium]